MGKEMQCTERLQPGRGAWKSDMSTHAQRYRFACQFVKGKRVLDAGCGVGYGARMLALAGASEVVAVDVSDEVLAEARTRFSHVRVRFICDDCETLAKVEPR